MPFTIDGQWIPSKQPSNPSKPVKVRLVKRGKSILTVILNLQFPSGELADLASGLKKKLGCGGGVKDDTVEIQGDKVEQVKSYLREIGVKSQ
ncbi:MAG: translation initiation factor [Parachlamydiaceae bacterium]|nr:translation initiation factor [Parachlamydiaceae bacterium]